eukprot:TRINITY_DN3676_c0_g1_i11.p2 TRINITY_DN3676_c0_g1~~TRINITY_DN3676_c0_g1_i11.p2  ORF type:complete len:282 (-),score=10.64 TRINITY_DN3676_c0_g1_i11:326-1072(-)
MGMAGLPPAPSAFLGASMDASGLHLAPGGIPPLGTPTLLHAPGMMAGAGHGPVGSAPMHVTSPVLYGGHHPGRVPGHGEPRTPALVDAYGVPSTSGVPAPHLGHPHAGSPSGPGSAGAAYLTKAEVPPQGGCPMVGRPAPCPSRRPCPWRACRALGVGAGRWAACLQRPRPRSWRRRALARRCCTGTMGVCHTRPTRGEKPSRADTGRQRSTSASSKRWRCLVQRLCQNRVGRCDPQPQAGADAPPKV